jgi:hypothetical protein
MNERPLPLSRHPSSSISLAAAHSKALFWFRPALAIWVCSAPIAAVQTSGTVSPKQSFVGAAAGWVELECAASSRHSNGSSGGSAVPCRPPPTSIGSNELGCGSSRKAVRAKSHRCFRSTAPACGRASYRRSACAHRRVPPLSSAKGCGGVISANCEVGQAGTSTRVRLKGGALWLALAAAGARLPLMGLMTKTRLSALVTSPNWAKATHEVARGLAHPTNKNWRQS